MSFDAFLIVSAVLFCIGLYGALARRNVLAVLMSIELMFNAVNLTLVAMAKYLAPAALQDDISSALPGPVFAVVLIPVAAAALARRDQGPDQRPFLIGQVARIEQRVAVVARAVFISPHRAPHETDRRRQENHNRF